MRNVLRGPSALVTATTFALAALLISPVARASTATDETHIIQMVNGTRAENKVQALRPNDVLVGMARRQAGRMAAKGTIFHNPDLGPEATRLGLHWLRLGENVGVGWDVDAVEEALVESPHHFENIVRPTYNAIGVGVAYADDRVFVAQVFGQLEAAKVTLPSAPDSVSAPLPPARTASPPPPPPIATPVPTPVPARPSPNALTDGVVSMEPIPIRSSDQQVPSRSATESLLARLLDLVLPG